MSSFVSYDQVCTSCLTSDGARGSIVVNGDVTKFKKQTEYEFSKILEEWFEEMNVRCRFCGSPFVEGSKIHIGDYKLYDFDRLVTQCKESAGELFLWKAIKKDRTIELKVGGKNTQDPVFVRECFIRLLEIVESYPEHKLIYNKQFGDLFICLTGEYDFETKSFNPVVQRFYCTGMSYQEAINCINKQLLNFEMHDLIRAL